MSSIPQLDGHLSEMDDVNIQPSDNVRTRIATFELNSAKQAYKIVQDTNAPDFEITHKDSSRNINISCNSGFYLEVAKLNQLME